jgi:hypothetical protein
LFIDFPATFPNSGASPGFVAYALNADGSVNSTNPAPPGSVVSVFVNGLVSDFPVQLSTTDGWSVTKIVQVNPFVLRVDAQVPPAVVPPGFVGCTGSCRLTLFVLNSSSANPHSSSVDGQAFGGIVYVQ